MTLESWDARIDAFYAEHVREDDPAGSEARMAAFLKDQPDVTAALAAFELAGVNDSTGAEVAAEHLYRQARALGLDEHRDARARIQLASTLRNLGRSREAVALLSEPAPTELEAARLAFLALALHSEGRTDEALRCALEAAVPALPQYQRSVRAYAAALTEPARP